LLDVLICTLLNVKVIRYQEIMLKRRTILECLRLMLLLTLIFGLILIVDDGLSIAAQKVGQPGFINPVTADITSSQPQVVQPSVTGLVSTLSDEV
jgi:hypothetical protein